MAADTRLKSTAAANHAEKEENQDQKYNDEY